MKNTIFGMYKGLESANASDYATPELIETFKTTLKSAKHLFRDNTIVKEMESPKKCKISVLFGMLGALAGAIEGEPDEEEDTPTWGKVDD